MHSFAFKIVAKDNVEYLIRDIISSLSPLLPNTLRYSTAEEQHTKKRDHFLLVSERLLLPSAIEGGTEGAGGCHSGLLLLLLLRRGRGSSLEEQEGPLSGFSSSSSPFFLREHKRNGGGGGGSRRDCLLLLPVVMRAGEVSSKKKTYHLTGNYGEVLNSKN